jgi:UDP-N-acetylmuramate--alanine ligase
MKKNKKIYFTGIKGVGMTPLAIIAKEAGFEVLGSDTEEEFITNKVLESFKIPFFTKFSPDNVTSDIGLLITTGAHGGFDNPEVKRAKELGIRVLTQGEAVGEFMTGKMFRKKMIGISVTGCHGKTTTTAMIATLLKENKLDPTYVIGTSEIPSLGMSGHFGKSNYFVAEADEYATEPKYDKTPKLFWQKPQFIVFTNLEFDHPDLYNSIADIERAFWEFVNQNRNATIIYNGDDVNLSNMLANFEGNKVSFGRSQVNDYFLKHVSVSQEQTFFWVEHKKTLIGEFSINTPGEYNSLNALASIILGIEIGLPIDKVKSGIAKFAGCKRRLEYIGKTPNGALVYDDYAHHPTEVKSVLSSLRKMFPKKKIICIFQSHTYSRTKSLLDEFSKSFTDCSLLILTKIFASEREKTTEDNLSEEFYLKALKEHSNTLFLPEFLSVVEYVEQKHYTSENVIITIGAGGVYKIGQELIKEK